jgi:hypothetical protein
MTRNNRNRNNQSAAAEEVSTEKFHYEELTPEQVAVLHQETAIDRHPMRSLACCLFIQKAGLTHGPYYIIQYYINTWSDHWHSYGNK